MDPVDLTLESRGWSSAKGPTLVAYFLTYHYHQSFFVTFIVLYAVRLHHVVLYKLFAITNIWQSCKLLN